MPLNKANYGSDVTDVIASDTSKNKYAYSIGGQKIEGYKALILDEISKKNGKESVKEFLNYIDVFAKGVEQASKTRSKEELKLAAEYMVVTANNTFKNIQGFEFGTPEEEKDDLLEAVNHFNHDKSKNKYFSAVDSAFLMLNHAKTRYADNKRKKQNPEPTDTAANTDTTTNTARQKSGSSDENKRQNQTQDDRKKSSTGAGPYRDEELSDERNRVDEESLLKLFMLNTKADSEANLVDKLNRRKHASEYSAAASDSVRWQNEVEKQQRSDSLRLLEMYKSLPEEMGREKGGFLKPLIEYHDMMRQGTAELKSIAESDSYQTSSLEISANLHKTIKRNIDLLREDMSRCHGSIKIVDRKIEPALMLRKTLSKLRKMNAVDLNSVYDRKFLTTTAPTQNFVSSHSNTFKASRFSPNVNIHNFNKKLSLEELATCISFYATSNISDAIKYIESSITTATTQPVLFSYDRRNKSKAVVTKTVDLANKLQTLTYRSQAAEDFAPLKSIARGLTWESSVKARIPTSVESIGIEQPGSSVIEEMGDVTDQKISNFINSKMLDFSSKFIETTTNLLSPFPIDFKPYSAWQENRVPSNIDAYTRILTDETFKKRSEEIEEKLSSILRAYDGATHILNTFKKSVEKFSDVPLVSYSAEGPKETSKSLKPLLMQKITEAEQSLNLEREEQIIYANRIVLGMLNKCKCDALYKTLLDSAIALKQITTCVEDIKDFMPTEEEIIIEKTFETSQAKASNISFSISSQILQALVVALSFSSIPIHVLNSVVSTLCSTVKFDLLHDISIGFTSKFAQKFGRLISESFELSASVNDSFDTLIFRIEEYIPNIKFLAYSSIILGISAAAIYSPVSFQLIEYLTNLLLFDSGIAITMVK